jgi:hypothetical protein
MYNKLKLLISIISIKFAVKTAVGEINDHPDGEPNKQTPPGLRVE